jgi:hypothetical protein
MRDSKRDVLGFAKWANEEKVAPKNKNGAYGLRRRNAVINEIHYITD